MEQAINKLESVPKAWSNHPFQRKYVVPEDKHFQIGAGLSKRKRDENIQSAWHA